MTADIKIDLTNKESLKKWCTELKCTEQDLIYPVNRMGNRVQNVNDFLVVNREKKERLQVSLFMCLYSIFFIYMIIIS